MVVYRMDFHSELGFLDQQKKKIKKETKRNTLEQLAIV